jgi:hypothetical protein
VSFLVVALSEIPKHLRTLKLARAIVTKLRAEGRDDEADEVERQGWILQVAVLLGALEDMPDD